MVNLSITNVEIESNSNIYHKYIDTSYIFFTQLNGFNCLHLCAIILSTHYRFLANNEKSTTSYISLFDYIMLETQLNMRHNKRSCSLCAE